LLQKSKSDEHESEHVVVVLLADEHLLPSLSADPLASRDDRRRLPKLPEPPLAPVLPGVVTSSPLSVGEERDHRVTTCNKNH
jgi:hypothetical protein